MVIVFRMIRSTIPAWQAIYELQNMVQAHFIYMATINTNKVVLSCWVEHFYHLPRHLSVSLLHWKYWGASNGKEILRCHDVWVSRQQSYTLSILLNGCLSPSVSTESMLINVPTDQQSYIQLWPRNLWCSHKNTKQQIHLVANSCQPLLIKADSCWKAELIN